MAAVFNNDWQNYLKDEFAKLLYQFKKIFNYEYKNNKIYSGYV
jgi:hypothetical protein